MLPTVRLLLSYHYFGSVDLCELVNNYAGKVEVFADSGAFSALTTGAVIKFADYAAWLRQWGPLLTVKSSLDVIGDATESRANFERLREAGLPVIPVFHVGSDLVELKRLCAEYGYVALGGMVTRDATSVARWLVQCFRIAREHGTVFHGFGQTNTKLINDFPFYSVDSTSWSTGLRFGSYPVWNHARRSIQNVRHGDLVQAKKFAQYLKDCGADPVAFARVGFALQGEKSLVDYHKERTMSLGVGTRTWLTYGDWLGKHHHVPPPAGFSDTGTVIYLAQANTGDVRGTLRYLSEVL
jgi:hypothetical protein